MQRSLWVTVWLLVSAVVLLAQTNSTTQKLGTATISGRITLGEKPAAGVTVGLLKADTVSQDDLAPGKYWLVVKAAQALEDGERLVRPLVWDATARAALRKDAEAAAQAVELGACMRLSDYKLAAGK